MGTHIITEANNSRRIRFTTLGAHEILDRPQWEISRLTGTNRAYRGLRHKIGQILLMPGNSPNQTGTNTKLLLRCHDVTAEHSLVLILYGCCQRTQINTASASRAPDRWRQSWLSKITRDSTIREITYPVTLAQAKRGSKAKRNRAGEPMTYIELTRGTTLGFWLEPEDSGRFLNLWVCRRGGPATEKYKVCGFTANGEFFRYPGLPKGWGFQLVAGGKIREIL